MNESSVRLRDYIDAVAEGDRAALEQLYRTTGEKLYGVVLRILHQPYLAEEALARAYLGIWREARAYEPGLLDPMSWMVTIARRAAHGLAHKRPPVVGEELFEGTEPPGEAREEAREEAPAEPPAMSEDLRRVLACLATLSEDQRVMLLLAHYDGRSYGELAIEFDAPAATIRTWLLRSLEQLRDCLRR